MPRFFLLQGDTRRVGAVFISTRLLCQTDAPVGGMTCARLAVSFTK